MDTIASTQSKEIVFFYYLWAYVKDSVQHGSNITVFLGWQLSMNNVMGGGVPPSTDPSRWAEALTAAII